MRAQRSSQAHHPVQGYQRKFVAPPLTTERTSPVPAPSPGYPSYHDGSTRPLTLAARWHEPRGQKKHRTHGEALNLPSGLRSTSSATLMNYSNCSLAHFQCVPYSEATTRFLTGYTIVTYMIGLNRVGKLSTLFTITELHTRMHFAILLCRRSEALSRIREVITMMMIERRFDYRVSRVPCDNAAKYLSKDLRSWPRKGGLPLTSLSPTLCHRIRYQNASIGHS